MSLHDDKIHLLREGVLAQMEKAGLPGCQYSIGYEGDIVVSETIGAPPDARFRMYSSTKPVVASVVWQLIAEQHLDPVEPIVTWWPEFGANGKDAVTLEHVMAHTAGFPNAPLTRAAFLDRDARVPEIEAWKLDWKPGTRYEYHGLTAHWVLAELIHRTTGQDHCTALRERILDPLDLDRLELGVPVARQGDIQPFVHVGEPPTIPEIEDLLGIKLGDLPPEMVAAFTAAPATPAAPTNGLDPIALLNEPDMLASGTPGSAGVSDAASFALFYQHLLHDPKGIWDPAVLHDAKTNVRNLHPDNLGRRAYRTLGFETAGDDDKRHMRIGSGATSPGTFGHSGAGGQVAWADPESGLSFVFFTNAFDVNFARMYRRDAAVTRLAAACIDRPG